MHLYEPAKMLAAMVESGISLPLISEEILLGYNWKRQGGPGAVTQWMSFTQ
jgi:hypothetical protein